MIISWIGAAFAVLVGLWVLSVVFKIIAMILDAVGWDGFFFALAGLLLFCVVTYYVHGLMIR